MITLLCSCKKAVKELNQEIPSEIVTAKEITKITDKIIKDEWGDKEFYLSEVTMYLDENHRGSLSLIYADGLEIKTTVPNMLKVQVNTNKHKVVRQKRLTRDSKLYPGVIAFDDWMIDSIDAYNLTLELFKEVDTFDRAIISSTPSFEGDSEDWSVILWKDKTRYSCFINSYTGKVISYNTEVVE
jgi:hypothetical protein